MKKFSIVNKGYDIGEVNKFVDLVIKRLELLNNENNANRKKIDSLTSELEKNSNIEERLANAIMAAEDASTKIKNLARQESEMIINDAKRNANSIIHEALVSAEKTQIEADLLRKNIVVYKNRIKSLLESELELVNDLDSIELENRD